MHQSRNVISIWLLVLYIPFSDYTVITRRSLKFEHKKYNSVILTRMNEKIEIGEVQVERLDDIPVILGHLQKNHIQEIVDQEIEPHGNWEGLSLGWIITIWLIHILSEHSHCMDRVREWVAKRLHVLQTLTGQALTELDFTDDRLAISLRKLSQTNTWQEIEAQLGRHLIRVYCLGAAPTVRLDATTGRVIRFSR